MLQTAQQRHLERQRIAAITNWVNQVSGPIYAAAQNGQTKYVIDTIATNGVLSHQYKPTTEELVEALKLKCPGCSVEFSETWEPSPRNPNQMNKKSGIIIDWT